MANPFWPSALPAPMNDSGQFAPLIDNVITSNMESGAPKRRRRFTAVPDIYTGSVQLSGAQTQILSDFATNVLKDVLPFDWKDWRTGAVATYTFQKRPTFTRVAGAKDLWRASIELMKKP